MERKVSDRNFNIIADYKNADKCLNCKLPYCSDDCRLVPNVKEAKRLYYANNRERAKGWAKKWRENHREQFKAAKKRWNEANVEKIREWAKGWRAAHRDWIRDYNAAYRKRKKLMNEAIK